MALWHNKRNSNKILLNDKNQQVSCARGRSLPSMIALFVCAGLCRPVTIRRQDRDQYFADGGIFYNYPVHCYDGHFTFLTVINPACTLYTCAISSVNIGQFRLHLTTPRRTSSMGWSYSNTAVYYGIHERSECIPVDSGVTNLIHDRRSCVNFTLEVEANVARRVHSSVNKPVMKCNSGLWDVYPLQTLLWS